MYVKVYVCVCLCVPESVALGPSVSVTVVDVVIWSSSNALSRLKANAGYRDHALVTPCKAPNPAVFCVFVQTRALVHVRLVCIERATAQVGRGSRGISPSHFHHHRTRESSRQPQRSNTVYGKEMHEPLMLSRLKKEQQQQQDGIWKSLYLSRSTCFK